MRELLLTNQEILLKLERLENTVTGNNGDIQIIFQYLKQLQNPEEAPRNRIGFRRSDEKD